MPQPKPSKPANFRFKQPNILLVISLLCLVVSALILFFTYQPVINEEIKFAVSKPQQKIIPKDKQFGIVIPKINANAAVIRNVDPFTPAVYQQALTRGVAHARGTGIPGERANIFLFAHSSGNWYQASRYNSVFYLLYKLKPKDKILVYFQNSKFGYEVKSLEYVNSESIEYLSRLATEETLTLMTCWPPGTTLKRLIVTATRTAGN